MQKIYGLIDALVEYGIQKKLIPELERAYTTNLLLDVFGLTGYEAPESKREGLSLEQILEEMLDWAFDHGVMADNGTATRDLYDTRIMSTLTPRPGQIVEKFYSLYEKDKTAATDWFYDFCKNCGYIRQYRVEKDMRWKHDSKYGTLDITINLSKPEKDPKAIAAAKTMKQSGYPKCQLCVENEGYAGTLTHPARQNLRILPITMNGGKWGFQYSPYSYYNEHCIALNGEHTPMKINEATFRKLFDFVKTFPHYFVGSNADLPIVGGSILTHDHFQGGRYTFAMEVAPIEIPLHYDAYPDIEAGIVRWPLSVIRLRGEDTERIVSLASDILAKWRAYSDPDAEIYAETNGEPHNTITPITRFRDGKYEIDLVLRNNRTTEDHPLGLFHPHAPLHHIKKENIGLIEVMGLAVLPARLKKEIADLEECILAGKDPAKDEVLSKHADWVRGIQEETELTAENIHEVLLEEIGRVFVQVLEDAGVYKCTPEGRKAFCKFCFE